MLSATSPLRSILKPSSPPSKDSPAAPKLSREERNRQVALHHARLLQHRKDIEARNLASTETLLDLPSSPSTSPSQPSTADTEAVKDALRTFQRSDFDALIEERNIDHRCGYILCPRENRSQNSSGKYRIVTGRKDIDFQVVNPKELARWCSDGCGKMALYLRVQLGEGPAWMREWQADNQVEMFNEKEERKARGDYHEKSAPWNRKTGPENRGEDMQERMKDLEVERGDKSRVDRITTSIAIRVKEKEQGGQTTPIPPSTVDNHEGAIEGYVPSGKRDPKRSIGQEEDVEDILPTI